MTNDWDDLATSTSTRVVPSLQLDSGAEAEPGRRPRILISTPIVDFKLYALDEWVASIRDQVCDIDYSVVLWDNTDQPRPGYLDWLQGFARSKPFGSGHRVRISRFGESVDGQRFRHPHAKVSRAHQLGWECASARSSATRPRDRIDAVVFWECDVIAPPTAVQTLWDSGYPWAAAWMLSRKMADQRGGLHVTELPLLWHSLTMDAWTRARGWDDVIPLGWTVPPSENPFPCSVTHLGLTMVRGEVLQRVPYQMTTAGGDCSQSWQATDAGYQLMCVPTVKCSHRCQWESEMWGRRVTPSA
jgi:hypothetical protein